EVSLGVGKHSYDLLVLSIALPSAVAARFDGLAGCLGRTSPGRRGTTRRGVELERAARLSGIVVHLGPAQDELAAYELCDPAFLTRLEDQAEAHKGYGAGGFIVAGGVLTSWKEGADLRDVGVRRLQAARRPDSPHAKEHEALLES